MMGNMRGDPPEFEYEIDLLDLWYYFLQSLKYIVPVVLVFVGIIAGITFLLITPKYVASSKLYVLSSKDSAINLSDLQIGSQLTNDYIEVFKTWEVHEQVLANLDLSFSHHKLQRMLSITNPANTRILVISVESEDPLLARNMANEYALVASEYISDVMGGEEPSILSEARTPSEQASPSLVKNIVLAAIFSFFMCFLVMLLRFITDDRIKSPEDIQKAVTLPTLAVIPKQRNSL